MKLLLHTCCAPCLIFPVEKLKQKGFEVVGLFYNPNIHPFAEYEKRIQAIESLKYTDTLEIIYPEYNPAEFFEAVNLRQTQPERCSLCWDLRLKVTARVAKEKGFDCFSTTLLVSPYQDQALLKKIGNEVAQKEGIEFYYEDFRLGFRKAHIEAKEKGIYCQKYCGCIYSQLETCKKSARR